jgi:hypothetical protein
MWLESETVFYGAIVLTCSAWLLRFPLRVLCGMATLPPTPAYEPYLTNEGIEPSDRRCHVLSHYIGWRDLRLPFQGCEGPETDDLLWCGPSGSLMDWIIHGEPHPYRGELI